MTKITVNTTELWEVASLLSKLQTLHAMATGTSMGIGSFVFSGRTLSITAAEAKELATYMAKQAIERIDKLDIELEYSEDGVATALNFFRALTPDGA